MARLRIAGLAFAASLSLVAVGGSASAMPVDQFGSVVKQNGVVQDARWVCGPYRCWWRPGPWGYGYGYGYGYGPGWRRPWGWRRGW